MLTAIAMLAASTPAAPLIAQNHGVGRESMALTSLIPVGNPKPINNPAGVIMRSAMTARTMIEEDSNAATSTGNQNGSKAR